MLAGKLATYNVAHVTKNASSDWLARPRFILLMSWLDGHPRENYNRTTEINALQSLELRHRGLVELMWDYVSEIVTVAAYAIPGGLLLPWIEERAASVRELEGIK